MLTVVLIVILATVDLHLLALVPLMIVMGVSQGIIRPARDMMLRAAAPKDAIGAVFGFASAGIAAGNAVAPIFFGMLLDWGRPAWVFYLIAGFMVVALVTVLIPRTGKRPAPA